MLLPDINVWLALTFDSHIHHPSAKAWFDGLSGHVGYFCRTTQQGFLRLTTNRKVFGAHALTLFDAWRKFDIFQSDPRVSYIDEPVGLETHWRGLTRQQAHSPRVWTDAYLAAFSIAAHLELVTFDKAMSKFPGLQCTILC